MTEYKSIEQKLWDKIKYLGEHAWKDTKDPRELAYEIIKGYYGTTFGILGRFPTSVRKFVKKQTFVQRGKGFSNRFGALVGGVVGTTTDMSLVNYIINSAYNNDYLPLAVPSALTLISLGCEIGRYSGKKEGRKEWEMNK